MAARAAVSRGRRRLVASVAASMVWPFGRAAAAVPDAALPPFDDRAFAVHTLPELLAATGLAPPMPSDAVRLDAPQLFEDGATVPITIACTAPGVQRWLLGVDDNPTWLVASFEPARPIGPALSLRIKMQQSSRVVVLAVLADGRVLMAARQVEITVGGCGGLADPAPEASGQPTLIRLQPMASGVQVRALFKHQMESGQRQDAAGQPVPAWHIRQVVARLDGEPVLRAQWGTAVAKDPFLQFDLPGVQTGSRVALAWADNRGATRSDEAVMR